MNADDLPAGGRKGVADKNLKSDSSLADTTINYLQYKLSPCLIGSEEHPLDAMNWKEIIAIISLKKLPNKVI